MGDFKRCDECDGVILKLDLSWYGDDYPYHGGCASCGKLFTLKAVKSAEDSFFCEGIKEFLFGKKSGFKDNDT